MKKRVFGRHFSRTKNQRTALFRGLITSLFENGQLTTTLIKAKAIKPEAEKIITKAKEASVADRRVIFKTLNNKSLVDKLIKKIAPVLKNRKGGYLRIVRLRDRKGDQAEMAKVLFTEEIIKEKPIVQSKEDKSQEKKNDQADKKITN